MMVAFYKHFIADWRGGTNSLSDRAYRVYHVIVEQIYVHEGPAPAHEKTLAGLSNRSVRDLRSALQELVGAGKIKIQDGKISNVRAETELVQVRTNRENAAKGGRTPRESSANGVRKVCETEENTNKNNAEIEATLQNNPSLKEKRRGENKEESSLRSDERAKAFEEFWSAYPQRDGENPKAPARKAFDALVKSGVDPKAILSGIRCAAATHRDKIGTPYIPQAQKWLRDRRFEDYLTNAKPNGSAEQPPSKEAQERSWANMLEYEAKHGHWQSNRTQKRDIPAEFIKRWEQERSEKERLL